MEFNYECEIFSGKRFLGRDVTDCVRTTINMQVKKNHHHIY